jgi:endoplasmic reticulum lectin 1
LGSWSLPKHLEWLEKHPSKVPSKKSDRTTLSLFYSNGDMCENKKRFVEVKLRCLKPSEKSHAVSLYLIEPVTCEYLLAVESIWLCDYIEKYDLNEIKEN